MIELAYPLSVLAKSAAYKNLSSASLHVGLSQPQLSRLISRLEKELGMELLDRRVKRKSTWTPQALKLAELFQDNERRLDHSIRALIANQRVRSVHLGTLEGLAEHAVSYARTLFEKGGLELIYLDVFDRNELEGKYLAGDLDLILNTRVPSHAKPRYLKVCGFQSLDIIDTGEHWQVYSTFEYNLRGSSKRQGERALISNSLFVRRNWLEKFGGHGTMPSELFEDHHKGQDEVLLIGGDWLDPHVWSVLESAPTVR